MNPITLTIPLALTVAQIARANPTLDSDNAALEPAQELHDLIAAVQAAYAAHPPSQTTLTQRLPPADEHLPYETAVAFELGDIIDTIQRAVLGRDPTDHDEACALDEWLMLQLTDIDIALYAQYLRLYDRIWGTNLLELAFDDDPPPVRSSASSGV